MVDRYGSHREYMEWVKKDAAKRLVDTEEALRGAFARFIEQREVDVVVFSHMSVVDLAAAITSNPAILKPLLTLSSLAGRAIERDLGIKNLNTYAPRLTRDQASAIAGYLIPFLPEHAEIAAITTLDRVHFIDKEVRKSKGRWEKRVLKALNEHSASHFRKRRFEVSGERFELDAATPERGTIRVGIDVKRIEARRDIHKRCDEILNKATKFKVAVPGGQFAAVVYYPFINEHVNVRNRLRSSRIDTVVFASDSVESIENAVQTLLSTLAAAK
jgi:hypothetical protein